MKKLLMVLTLLTAVPTILLAQTTAKALYCAENTTLYFVYDNDTYTPGSSTYTPDGETDARTVTKVYTNFLNGRQTNSEWYDKTEMTTADFQSSFAACRPTSTKYWFYNMTALTTINHIENLKTSDVTEMHVMFSNCNSLTSLDLSKFDTSKVTKMQNMFKGCSGLTSLDLSKFDTSNVRNMISMFSGCSGLTSLDLSNFDTSKANYMSSMFSNCSGLNELKLNVSSFNTGNVTEMQSMFNGCSKLTSLNVSSFNTGKVTTIENMFNGCSGLKSLTFGENFATKSLNSYAGMFHGMNARFIDFSNSTYNDTDNAITAVNRSTSNDMFEGVKNTAVIYLPKGSPAPSGDTQNVVYTKDGKLVCDDYYSEDKVDIELPHDFKTKKAQYSRTMSRKYGTVILPYDFTSNDEIQCYTMTQEHTKTMYFVPTQTVPAHTPFLFEKKSSGNTASFIMEDANYGITVKATKDTETDGPYEVTYDNIKAQEKVGSADGETMSWTTRGYYVNQTVPEYNGTYYIAKDKFYLADDKLTLYPHRATFVGSWKYGLSSAPFLNIGIIGADGEEQELTAIESAELFNTVNGISAIFDAQGRRLQQLQPGLNIVHMEDGTVRKVMGK